MTQQSCGAPANLAQSATGFLERMAQINQESMTIGLRGAKAWFDAYTQLVSTMMPVPGPAACQIPQTQCPPYCACTLEWTVVPGDARIGHIRIKNTAKEPIFYSLEATPLHTCGKTTETRPGLTPQSGRAAPGESLLVQVSVSSDKSWLPGETYESEIKIRGLYERCVCLLIHVPCEPEPCCAFEMGEIPKRIRVDNWWQHYQCTELCFEAIPQRGVNDDSPVR